LDLKEMALAITATAAVAIGIAVYQRAPDRAWNRLFAVHAAGGGVWTFLNYLVETAPTPELAGLWLRLTHPVVAMVICTVVDFAWTFPERIDYIDGRRRQILYATGSLFGLVALAPNLFNSIRLVGDSVLINYGWPFAAFGLFTVTALGYTDLVLLSKARKLRGVQRVQVLWVLVGLMTSHAIASVAIIIIPLVWGTTAYSGWGAGGYITTLAGMAYAIAKHRLMQPEIALRRVVVAVVTVSLVLTLGVQILRAVEPLTIDSRIPLSAANLGAGILMGMLIIILHGRLTTMMRQTPALSSDPAVVQAVTSSQILRTLDSDHLLELLAGALDETLKPASMAIFTRSAAGDRMVPRAVRRHPHGQRADAEPSIDTRHPVLQAVAEEGALLTRDQVFRFSSQSDARRLSKAMDELHAQVVAPMIWEDELIGAIILSSKFSGEMYEDYELRLVWEMAMQSSLALRNADLYAETASLKEFNERILSQMDNAVVVTNENEEIVIFNAAAERLFEVPADRAHGASIDLLPDCIAHCIRASLGSGRILPSRHFEMVRGEAIIPLACSTSPVEADFEGRRQGAVAVISDLTLIQELERERQEAERLALIRVISAGMAHEIRNPLVAIRTFAELAPRRLDDPEFRSNFLTVVQEEIRRIDRLVGDLLTLSKPADAVVDEVEIAPICDGVLRATAGMAEAREVGTRLELADLPGVVMGDAGRIHQALLNLVSNAIDAEPPGGSVTLRARARNTMDGREAVVVSVHNPGSYIQPEHTEEIFRPFVSKKTTGTGLGLAICQTIIEEHQGRIFVESTPELGTTFVVELPLLRTQVAAPVGAPA